MKKTRTAKPKSIKAHKYGAKKTEYNGIMYDSKKEADYAYTLDMKVQHGIIKSYRRQVRFTWVELHQLHSDETKSLTFKRSYVADFVTVQNDGTEKVWDVKGYKTSEYLKKKKIIEAIYNIKINEL